MDLRDHLVVAGGRRGDEAVQILDKESQMIKMYKPEGGWTKEFKDYVYSLMYDIHRELDLRTVLDPQQQEAARRLVEVWASTFPHKEVDSRRPEMAGIGLADLKVEGAWTPGFKADVYQCIKSVARELGINSPYYMDEEQSRWLIKFWVDMHPPIDDCLMHRCPKHLHVGQLNSSVDGGVECGACILLTCKTAEQVVAQEMYKVGEDVNKAFKINIDQTTVGPQPGTGGPLAGAGVATAGTKLASELGHGQRHMMLTLIDTWHKRFKNVVNVGDEAHHTGGFPVMGEVYHRTERTNPCKTFHEAFRELERILLTRECFQGETLYVRRPPAIENVFDFNNREHIWRGMARWSFTIHQGTKVTENP